MTGSTEIFFRREETAREQVTLPAQLFNRCLLLLNHAPTANVFVPVRSMQLQAVIDQDEIIFVDNHGYAVKDGHGGRLIVLAWEMAFHSPRDSLNEPVPIEVRYYGPERHEIHRRLMSGTRMTPVTIAKGITPSIQVAQSNGPDISNASRPRAVVGGVLRITTVAYNRPVPRAICIA